MFLALLPNERFVDFRDVHWHGDRLEVVLFNRLRWAVIDLLDSLSSIGDQYEKKQGDAQDDESLCSIVSSCLLYNPHRLTSVLIKRLCKLLSAFFSR